MRLISWNINGIRAITKKGFVEWLMDEFADVVSVQEIKADVDQVPKQLVTINDYHKYYRPADKKGYSGVASFSQEEPKEVKYGFGIDEFDAEGRTLILDFEKFVLFNIYYPNGSRSQERLDYKLRFYDAFLEYADNLVNDGRKVVICGDFNTAHNEIDLARPKQNEKNSGFLPIEREWMDKLVEHHYIDTFRYVHNDAVKYSWWDYKTRARERNVGWRIDYFFVSENMKENISDAGIMTDVFGSDHCPIYLDLDI